MSWWAFRLGGVSIELSPRLPDGERPSDYAGLAAEQHRNHRLIGETQLCGRLVWSLDKPVAIGPYDTLPLVETVPAPAPRSNEISDRWLVRLLGALSERERKIVWAKGYERSWADAATAVGATAAEGERLRRKVKRLSKCAAAGSRGGVLR